MNGRKMTGISLFYFSLFQSFFVVSATWKSHLLNFCPIFIGVLFLLSHTKGYSTLSVNIDVILKSQANSKVSAEKLWKSMSIFKGSENVHKAWASNIVEIFRVGHISSPLRRRRRHRMKSYLLWNLICYKTPFAYVPLETHVYLHKFYKVLKLRFVANSMFLYIEKSIFKLVIVVVLRFSCEVANTILYFRVSNRIYCFLNHELIVSDLYTI